MNNRADIGGIDWLTVLLYAILVIAGWLNIYAAVYSPEIDMSVFDLSYNAGKQLLWISLSVFLISAIFIIDHKFYDRFAFLIYGVVIFLLLLVLIKGGVTNGAKSWFKFGSFKFQPSELSKLATALAVAKIFAERKIKFTKLNDLFLLAGVIGFPAILIILQGDTGSALVFGAFILVLYREGLTPLILILGVLLITLFVLTLVYPNIVVLQWILGISIFVISVLFFRRKKYKSILLFLLIGAPLFYLIFYSSTIYLLVVLSILILLSIIYFLNRRFQTTLIVVLFTFITSSLVIGVDFFVNKVLQPHQQNRIKALVNPDADPLGYGWNVTQSKIAIGSGGISGKGFLHGTQTKFDFVPEQSTDFIFCTIGEEHGFFGSVLLVVLFVIFLSRIVLIAERQKTKFARAYAYGVVSILFFHFAINVGMTIGLAPVIGIPLPFFSYGGSSLWSFTILLFILLKLDAHRMEDLAR